MSPTVEGWVALAFPTMAAVATGGGLAFFSPLRHTCISHRVSVRCVSCMRTHSFPHQNGGTEGEKDDESKKCKRRPRPEPLFIPPPKPSVFIAPPVYSSITPYQSHLRSPVRLADNPLTMPPYTPPPILSPVREGSGLYFSTFLSAAAAAASSQGLPPPATPKSATRSLLRSSEFTQKFQGVQFEYGLNC